MIQVIETEGLFGAEATLLLLFVVIILVALAARQFRLPYTTVLVVVGLGIALSGVFPKIELTPDLVLLVFLPPLAFEAAFHLRWERLRRDLVPVGIFALFGVVLTTLVAGLIMVTLLGIPLELALLFGALIAATDPVSVVALFRELGVSRRLSTLMEGESLFNDGTSIVLFQIVLAIVVTGVFNPGEGLVAFVRLVIGGIALGAGLGYVASRLLSRFDDYLIEISVTVVLAWGSYLLGDALGVSGVITTVMAGLVLGNYGARISFSPTTKLSLEHILEFIAFVANSFIFLLIGLQVEIILLRTNFFAVGAALVAAVAARAVAVYSLSWVSNRVAAPIPFQWQHVLVWGGLRGGVTLALALSLPSSVPMRQELIAAAFGVVLFSLVLQGLTVRPLVNLLGLAQDSTQQREYQETRARLFALRAGERHLERLRTIEAITPGAYQAVQSDYESAAAKLESSLDALYAENPALKQTEITSAETEGLRAQRSELYDLYRSGIIGDELYSQLSGELDGQLQARDAETDA